MIAKTFEVRDTFTLIHVLAVKFSPTGNAKELSILRAAGFLTPSDYVVVWKLSGGPCTYDAFSWPDRTMRLAHGRIVVNFDALESGAVIDVSPHKERVYQEQP